MMDESACDEMRRNGVMAKAIGWIVGGLAAAAAVTPAAAEPAGANSTDWTVTLGVEGRVLPSFEGSDRYVLLPVPLIDVRRTGTPRQFKSARDGASIGLIETGQFRLGPTLNIVLPRRERDDGDLRGLGDVGWTVELGVFAEYWPASWLRTRVELRQGIGGHHGVVSDLSADLVVPVNPQLTLSGGPRMTLASSQAMSPYFSITAAQSAASGLPMFNAAGGVKSYGVGGLARYEWTRQWATHYFVEYQRLTGDAANSPLILQRGSSNQITTGIGVTYSFDTPGLIPGLL